MPRDSEKTGPREPGFLTSAPTKTTIDFDGSRRFGQSADIDHLGFDPDLEERLHDERVAAGLPDPYLWDDFDRVLAGNLAMPEPGVLYREDGRGLLYPGRVNLVFGEDAVGKTWVALIAAKAVLDAGGLVLHLDYDDTAVSNVDRLLALGLDREVIRAGYRHRTDPGKIHDGNVDAIIGEIREAIADGRPVLVIFDVVADGMSAHDLDENKASDYIAWSTGVVQPMARAGACVTLNDHVTKSSNGGYSRGSGAKRAKVDGVAYEVTAPVPLARQQGGTLALTIQKDRQGQIGRRSEIIARILFASEGDELRVRIVVPTPAERLARTTGDRIEDLTRAAVAACKASEGPLSRKKLEERITLQAKATDKRAGIQRAIDLGAIEVSDGPRNAVMHRFVRDLSDEVRDEVVNHE